MTPRATYRIQFHKGFTFTDGTRLAPYLAALGISHLYSSPILAARAGSMHGYDVIDPSRINPELGGEAGFRALAAALRAHDIGIVLDIVPNHMAVGGADNPYWLDLLESGRDSIFAGLFDIDWEPAQPNLRDKVLAPFLGKPVEEALSAGDIRLVWDKTMGKFTFAYAEHRFPLRRADYEAVIGGAQTPEQADLHAWNAPERLRGLLAKQNFRLAYWRDAGRRINWRRFFDITGLAALRMEDGAVFEWAHATIFRLYAEGLIDGLRIDHVDGLADPRGYCRRLRARLDALKAGRAYVVVEKILAAGEALPADWEVDGTTGYDFMNQVSALEHEAIHAQAFAALWGATSDRPTDFESEERLARREILGDAFLGALRATAAWFRALHPTLGQNALESALIAVLEFFRAYRTYATGDAAIPPPGAPFEAALEAAMRQADAEGQAALTAIACTMRGEQFGQGDLARDAARRFNQLAAPVAAKAVEDTAFYRYGRLLSRNDVGFSPSCFGLSKADFLAHAARRQEAFPHAMLATATHDHKRGEDTRARLAALSEIPGQWRAEVHKWRSLNAALAANAVDPGDEYQLYQTLLGCWPPGLRPDDEDGLSQLARRVVAWREKSLREAKLRTSWSEPDIAFETANADFVRALLDPQRSAGFLSQLADFAEHLAPAGILNSLVQCVLRCTAPGVPDLYQGAEFWDLSLVDPDNRRPVDFAIRERMLTSRLAPSDLLSDWQTGQVKLSLVASMLALRKRMPDCFDTGAFRPVSVSGVRADNVIAFARTCGRGIVLIALPRLCAQPCMDRKFPNPEPSFWQNTALRLSEDLRGCAWQNVLGPRGAFDCATLFADFPAAILLCEG